MDPINLQKQLRNNNADLMNFCADLKQWGEEMKQKDTSFKEDKRADTNVPLVRKKVKKKSESNVDKSSKVTKRIKGIDYSAWDKFDVDAECAKLEEKSEDEESDELTDEYDETLREEAICHKEKGNKFVKKEKWNQAIECYTKAIECYAYDPVFYANRALCHLKNQDYRLAESDCTTAIQLDKTYVKAYHRRAMAREALNQLTEAHDDLLKVFDYEPDNKESKTALAKLEKKLESVAKETCTKTSVEQRPKSKFTLSRQQKAPLDKKQDVNQTVVKPTTFTAVDTTSATYWPSGNDIELIKPINKAPHLRSKLPLRRIRITDGDSITAPQEVVVQPLPSLTSDNNLIKCDDFKVVERKIENYKANETTKDKLKNEIIPETQNKNDTFSFAVPDTSVQFNYDWRLLRNNPEWKFLYLKQVHPKKLKKIFNESLECEIFSGIINTLANKFIEKNLPIDEYLLGLTEVKRFNMLAMFMTDDDKKDLWKLVDYMRSDRSIPEADINNIINKYSL